MNRDWGPLSLITQVGVTMAVSIVAFLLLGLWLDDRFQTKPLATLLLMVVGLLVGSIGVYRMIAAAIDSAAEQREADTHSTDQSPERQKEDE